MGALWFFVLPLMVGLIGAALAAFTAWLIMMSCHYIGLGADDDALW
jgi:hypothetical protein